MTNYLPVLIFLSSLLLLSPGLGKPFVGIHDWNGARYGNIARHMTLEPFVQRESQDTVYSHYPALLPFAISTSYRLFGISELSTRLVPYLATAFTIVLLYYLLRLFTSSRAACITCLIFLSTPMLLYYGKNPVHEPLALLFISLTLLSALTHRWWFVYLGLLLASVTNWSGPFLALGLTIIFFKQLSVWRLFSFWLIPIFVASWHISHSAPADLLTAFLLRANLTESDPFTLGQFINQIRIWLFILYTPVTVVLGLVGLALFYRRFGFLGGLAILSIGYPLVFSNASYVHEYYIFTSVLLLAFSLAKIINIFPHLIQVGILVLVALLSQSYHQALKNSHGDDLARQAGLYLRDNTPIGAAIQIVPTDYGLSRFPYLAFYSHRDIVTINPNYTLYIHQANNTFSLSRND